MFKGGIPSMPHIKAFIKELQLYESSNNDVCNPWKDWHPELDIGREAPQIRATHLENYLRQRINQAKWIFVAEALGYQGGRFSGIAMTSERILLGFHKEVDPSFVLSTSELKRTSHSKNSLLNTAQRQKGFAEPTASIVWKEIIESNINPNHIILWNIFPFHPYDPKKGPLSNRTPCSTELQKGVTYVQKLLNLCSSPKVVAIGKHSRDILNQYGIENIHVPHPANGGANDFKAAIKLVFQSDIVVRD